MFIFSYWFSRLVAADPGRKRLKTASKATISVITAVVIMLIVLKAAGSSQITAAILAGVIGLMGILVVNDETTKAKKVTTGLVALSSAVSLGIGSFLSRYGQAENIFLVLLVFLSFYLQKFGIRYFSLSMVAFMSFYFASILHVTFSQLPWLLAGVVVGACCAFIYNFVIFKDRPANVLRSSMKSFHIQVNLVLDLIIELIQKKQIEPAQIKQYNRNIKKLAEYARVASKELGNTDPHDIWPGVTAEQMRLYVFDTVMLLQTYSPAIRKLSELKAFNHFDIQQLLLKLVESIREAEVLNENPTHSLTDAAQHLQELRQKLSELEPQDKRYKDWLYLIRRIETISNHVIDEAYELQQAIVKQEKQPQKEAEEKEGEEDNDEEKGLKPSTKKSIQAVITAVATLIFGSFLSPSHQYWALLAGYLVLLGTETIGSTFVKAVQRSVGTLLGAAVGFVVASFVSPGILEITLLFICVFMAFYFFPITYSFMSFWITMMLAFMYDMLLGGISESLLLARVLDTVVGVGIGLAVSALVFPKRTRDKITDTSVEYVAALKEFVHTYLHRFTKQYALANLADKGMELEKKLKQLHVDSDPIIKGFVGRSRLQQFLTVFTAINYYAKHLVASSTRNGAFYKEAEFHGVVKEVEEKVASNFTQLEKALRGERGTYVYTLEDVRQKIEQSLDYFDTSVQSRNLQHLQLLHNIYYVWKINQSVVHLAKELGAEEISSED